jgi:hypothetical protein
MTDHQREDLEVFRRMLDPKNWPVRKGEYFIMEGEVFWYVSDSPLEERVFKPLFRGKFQ